jgi:hypothetical protein
VLNIQVMALSLIPVLSGGIPVDTGAPVGPLDLIGIEQQVTRDFLIGTWRHSDHFFRWGMTDKKKARVQRFPGHGLMTLNADGTMEMVNLFKPEKGRWEISRGGILIYDPTRPDRGSQILPVRKRGKDRMWLMLPFANCATGVGMERVASKEAPVVRKKAQRDAVRNFSRVLPVASKHSKKKSPETFELDIEEPHKTKDWSY